MSDPLHSRVGDTHDNALSDMLHELAEWAQLPVSAYLSERINPFVILCRTCPITGKIRTIKPVGPPWDILGRKLKNFTGTEVEAIVDQLAASHGSCAEAHLEATVAACLNRYCKPHKPRKR